jgi:hypothetical protein
VLRHRRSGHPQNQAARCQQSLGHSHHPFGICVALPGDTVCHRRTRLASACTEDNRTIYRSSATYAYGTPVSHTKRIYGALGIHPLHSQLIPSSFSFVVRVGAGEVAERVLHGMPTDVVRHPDGCRRVLLAALTHDRLLKDRVVRFHHFLPRWFGFTP